MKRARLAAVSILLFGCVAVFAHPHVFIADKVGVVFDGGVLKGIALSWTFDEMFSATILSDYHPRADGTFSPEVTAAIKVAAFDNLENYHYFLVVTSNGKAITPLKIERFTPTVVDKTKIVYLFFVPLGLPVTSKDQEMRLTVYDDSYFVAFDILKTDQVEIRGGDAVDYNLSVQKTTVKPSWPGQYMPDELVLRFRARS